MSALETAKFRQLNQLIKTTMHLHRGFFMPIFSTMHLHRAFFMPIQKAFSQQSGNSAGKEHYKPGFLRQRRAPHRGAHRQRQSAGSHRHQTGPTGPPSTPAPSWPAWSAAWPPPACTRRSSSWWVTTKPECSKRPSRVGGLFCCCAENAHIAKVVNTLNFVQKAKDGSRFSTHCRLYSGALSGTRTLGPLIKSQLLYQLS